MLFADCKFWKVCKLSSGNNLFSSAGPERFSLAEVHVRLELLTHFTMFQIIPSMPLVLYERKSQQ